MHLLRFIIAFILFFLKVCFQNKNTPSSYLKKNHSCFAVNALVELLNYRFNTANEKTSRLEVFHREAVLRNVSHVKVSF